MASPTDPQFRWTTDKDGNAVMPDPQREFLEWLLNPMRTPEYMEEYAAEHDMDARTLRRWKNDPRFKSEWRAKADEKNISPERTQAVIENLWKVATGNSQGATKAAELYLKYVQLYTPTQRVLVEDSSIDTMSDEDLAKMAGFAEAEQ